MKAIILILVCIFSLDLMAETQFSPLQREAVRFMIEDSRGQYDSDSFVDLLRASHLLTKKELKRFPELIPHADFKYVLINLDDCVYDLAIVVIDPEGEALNALYIDSSERKH